MSVIRIELRTRDALSYINQEEKKVCFAFEIRVLRIYVIDLYIMTRSVVGDEGNGSPEQRPMDRLVCKKNMD